MSGAGQSSVIARRESIESSSSEEIQFEENQRSAAPKTINSRKLIDDDCAHRREELDDPEQEFLLRLQERHGESVDRHAILHCLLGDLKSYSDLKPFLDFEEKQTTAPEKLKNPAGHYSAHGGQVLRSSSKTPRLGHSLPNAWSRKEDRAICRAACRAEKVFFGTLQRNRRMLGRSWFRIALRLRAWAIATVESPRRV
jgi:hypothetical protein